MTPEELKKVRNEREAIRKHLEQHPGATLSDIARAVKLSSRVTQNRLGAMRRGGITTGKFEVDGLHWYIGVDERARKPRKTGAERKKTPPKVDFSQMNPKLRSMFGFIGNGATV